MCGLNGGSSAKLYPQATPQSNINNASVSDGLPLNDIRKYEIKTGTTVAYGKEKVTKESGNTSMGIALDAGTGGDMIRVCFGGYCECSTATTGQIITGTGVDPVKAQSPKNGWLWVNPIHQYYSTTGGVVHEPFAEASWDEIASVSEAGLAAEVYNLGDTKDIEISGVGTMTLEIADFNHDYLSGSTSADKADTSLITKDLLPSTRPMNQMLSNDDGFPASGLYNYLNTTILNGLPTDLNNHVKMIYKWYGTGGGTTDGEWRGCKVWVPLEYEFFGDETYAPSTEHSIGNARQYPIFTDNASRIKKLNNGSGSANWYWEASPVASAATTFCNVTSSGNADGFSANSTRGVCFGLSI